MSRLHSRTFTTMAASTRDAPAGDLRAPALARAVAVLVAGILAAGCPSSHDPQDSRPPCPEGDDLVLGEACTVQEDCDPSHCGRVAGICVDYVWRCGQCDFCFFEQTEHVENSFLPCNPDTGICEE